jgi:acetolactate decarboxylase
MKKFSRLFLLSAALLVGNFLWAAVPVGQVQWWGHFRQLMHSGDTGAKVQLADLPSGRGVYALGALADLRGEVFIWDGRVLVSRGEREDGGAERVRSGDAAALLVLSRVPSWQKLSVPRDLDQAAFERFVLDRARETGVDADRPFAFALRGPVFDLKWHVLSGKAGGAHGTHKMGHAASRAFAAARSDGLLLGFYSGTALEGVITHPGEQFHVHWASADLAKSGHVDAYRVAAGAELLLPPPVR